MNEWFCKWYFKKKKKKLYSIKRREVRDGCRPASGGILHVHVPFLFFFLFFIVVFHFIYFFLLFSNGDAYDAVELLPEVTTRW